MYKIINECRCCGSKDLSKYLDLGKQPLANSYHKGEGGPEFPLEVNVCKKCFHSQLSIVVEPELMFKNYLYVSGTTQTFRDHCQKLAEQAVAGYDAAHTRVLDVACNDASLLECFRKLGCKVYGVDPAENLRALTEEKGIPVVVDYWGQAALDKLKAFVPTGKFDIITGTNVFAHVDNVLEFLRVAQEALSLYGTIILEFPYCRNMVAHRQFDTIYHEHLSYFLVNSFAALVKRTQLRITDIVQTPIHGGSIRFMLRHSAAVASSNDAPHPLHIQALINEEHDAGLLKIGAYEEFTNTVVYYKDAMNRLMKFLKSVNAKLVGYGASAKGNTMLNYFGLNLDYVVDDNPMKIGYLTPGRNIPIKPTSELANEGANVCILVMAWNFMEEIVKKIVKVRGNRDGFILTYVPTVGLQTISVFAKEQP